MDYAAKLEVHFHEQDRVSVLFESNGGPDEKLGELTLFAAYACRQMVNLGRGRGSPADSLANLLVESCGNLQALAGHRTPGGTHLVTYAGAPGRKRFEARLQLSDEEYSFAMNPRGFGLLGQGLGYYAPTSVTMLLQHLVERRVRDEKFQSALGRVAQGCGLAFTRGVLTVTSQNDVALNAVVAAGGAEVSSKAEEVDESRDEPHAGVANRDALANDPAIVALLERNGGSISMENWLEIMSESPGPIAFSDFSIGMKTAFHSVAVDQTDIFRKNFPEAAPTSTEDLLQEIGGYVMNGYIIGRHLLGTHEENLSSATDGQAQEVASHLLEEMGRTPGLMIFKGGEGIEAFMDPYLAHYSQEGVYGRIKDREKVANHLFLPILNGFSLAIAEHKMASRP